MSANCHGGVSVPDLELLEHEGKEVVNDDVDDEEQELKTAKSKKRKFIVDYNGELNAANKGLKRLAGSKKSDLTDGILSNEDFKRIKELKGSGGLSNRQKERHKKVLPRAAKRAKISRSQQEKRVKKQRSGKQFRGKKAWK